MMENQFFDRYFFTDITCCLSDVNITVNRQRQKQRQRQMTFELTSNTFGLDIIKNKRTTRSRRQSNVALFVTL